ncbi:MAG: ribulose-phosphate 3-epimerase [Christensenellaceae bacterium]|jgi:ribulose-phosphate 3-epimerase|nr:ribulose-phosphate 3-epimerase [Christensenellaceae bacterium]
MNIKIAPSTNPPKPEDMLEYIKELNALDVDYIHCDIMDGKFVTATTFGADITKKIAEVTKIPLNVHLMVKKPKDVKQYIRAGASIVTIHLEAFEDIKQVIKTLLKIAKLGAIPSASIKPNTPLEKLWPILGYVGMVLVMSVEPGKSGQEFIAGTLDRIAQIKKKLGELGLDDVLVEVDGGVNNKNIADIKKTGADIVVVGNYLYSAVDRGEAIKKLKK